MEAVDIFIDCCARATQVQLIGNIDLQLLIVPLAEAGKDHLISVSKL